MNLDNMKIYESIKFDYIFHLAAVTKAGDYCLKHKGDQWISNQTINTNILTYWKEKQKQANTENQQRSIGALKISRINTSSQRGPYYTIGVFNLDCVMHTVCGNSAP